MEIVERDNDNCFVNKIIDWVANMVVECSRMLKKDWDVKISHIFREQNRAADVMAKLSFEWDKGFRVFKEPPATIHEVLIEDSRRVPTGRSCATTCIRT